MAGAKNNNKARERTMPNTMYRNAHTLYIHIHIGWEPCKKKNRNYHINVRVYLVIVSGVLSGYSPPIMENHMENMENEMETGVI